MKFEKLDPRIHKGMFCSSYRLYNEKGYFTHQGNNAPIFPGVGLGELIAQLKKLDQKIFYIAFQILSNYG